MQFPTHSYEVQRSEDIAIRCTPGVHLIAKVITSDGAILLRGASAVNSIQCLAAFQEVAATGNAIQRLVHFDVICVL